MKLCRVSQLGLTGPRAVRLHESQKPESSEADSVPEKVPLWLATNEGAQRLVEATAHRLSLHPESTDRPDQSGVRSWLGEMNR